MESMGQKAKTKSGQMGRGVCLSEAGEEQLNIRKG